MSAVSGALSYPQGGISPQRWAQSGKESIKMVFLLETTSSHNAMKNCKQESVKNQTQDPIHGSNNVINIPHRNIIKREKKRCVWSTADSNAESIQTLEIDVEENRRGIEAAHARPYFPNQTRWLIQTAFFFDILSLFSSIVRFIIKKYEQKNKIKMKRSQTKSH